MQHLRNGLRSWHHSDKAVMPSQALEQLHCIARPQLYIQNIPKRWAHNLWSPESGRDLKPQKYLMFHSDHLILRELLKLLVLCSSKVRFPRAQACSLLPPFTSCLAKSWLWHTKCLFLVVTCIGSKCSINKRLLMYQLILSTCFLISVSIVFVVRCTLWFCITKNPMVLYISIAFIACPTETAHGCRVRLPLWFDLRVWASCEQKREKKALIVGSQVRTLPNLGKSWQIHANHPESSENMSGCHRVPWVNNKHVRKHQILRPVPLPKLGTAICPDIFDGSLSETSSFITVCFDSSPV